MERVQPGHEVLSLWGMTPQHQAQSSAALKAGRRGSLVRAFLIVAVVAAVLGVFSRISLGSSSQAVASQSPQVIIEHSDEPVAYQPGKFISSILRQGYLGR